MNQCFTVKKGFVRATAYESNSVGAIIYTNECIPNKGLTTSERKSIVTKWLIDNGFNVSEDII